MAMKTGILAAEAAFGEITVSQGSRAPLHMNGYQQQLDMSWVVFELEAVCDSTMPCDSAHAMHRTAQQQHDHVVLPLEWTGASVA